MGIWDNLKSSENGDTPMKPSHVIPEGILETVKIPPGMKKTISLKLPLTGKAVITEPRGTLTIYTNYKEKS